jgi:hypothetical protein
MDSNYLRSSGLERALQQQYPGEITSVNRLPVELSEFDAVFYAAVYSPNSLESSALIDYLRQGGRFCYESGCFHTADAELNALLGVSFCARTLSMYNQDSIYGKAGSFAEGLYARLGADPVQPNMSSALHVYGESEQILFGGASAFRFEREGYKVVMHWPENTEVYDAFLGRVACNYFGLCEALPLTAVKSRTANSNLRFDFLSQQLLVAEPEAANTSIRFTNILGQGVGQRTIDPTGRCSVAGMPPGMYYASPADGSRRGIMVLVVK